MPQIRPVRPVMARYTTWRNPLPHIQQVDIVESDPQRPTRYELGPGEEMIIPSEYDRAIHSVHNGVIIGGIAPQLINVDLEKAGKHPVLTDALNTQQVAQRQAALAVALAVEAKRHAEEEALLAKASLSGDAPPKAHKPPRKPAANVPSES